MDVTVPKDFEDELKLISDYLKNIDCTEVILFRSLAGDTAAPDSDIDLAVKGLEKNKYFRAYGDLLGLLQHPFDLVGLDYDNDFSRLLLKSETLERGY